MTDPQDIFITEADFRKRYEYGPSDLLGEGGFAQVYKAFDKQFEEYVALKFYNKGEKGKYDVLHEMKDSRSFSHKNIIRVHDAFVVRFDYIGTHNYVQVGVLQFANGGNLRDFISTKPLEKAFIEVLKGILYALDYLHTEMKIIHRDLSPENILMYIKGDRWIPKIADFGIAKKVDYDTAGHDLKKSTQLLGKIDYMAPEQFYPEKFGINGKINTSVDIWAFGIILYELFMHKTPFTKGDEDSPMHIIQSITSQPLTDIQSIPEPYRAIIAKCLNKEASKRVRSAQELIAILQSKQKDTSPESSKTMILEEVEKPKISLKWFWIALASVFIIVVGFFTTKYFFPKDNEFSNLKHEVVTFMNDGKYSEALNLLDELPDSSLKNSELYLFYAECKLQDFNGNKQFSETISYYGTLSEEMKLNSNLLDPYQHAGLIYWKNEIKRLSAVKEYRKAKEVIDSLDNSIKRNPEIMILYQNLNTELAIDSLNNDGIKSYDKGDLNKAKTSFNMVFQYDPQNEIAKDYLSKINYIPPKPIKDDKELKSVYKQYFAGNSIMIDSIPNPNWVRLISIELTDAETKIILEYQDSIDVLYIPEPGSEKAYFLEYNNHKNEIPLKAYIGATPPDTLKGIENSTKITYVFHRLPNDVKVFNLLDGKRQSDTSTTFLNFIGIRLIK